MRYYSMIPTAPRCSIRMLIAILVIHLCEALGECSQACTATKTYSQEYCYQTLHEILLARRLLAVLVSSGVGNSR